MVLHYRAMDFLFHFELLFSFQLLLDNQHDCNDTCAESQCTRYFTALNSSNLLLFAYLALSPWIKAIRYHFLIFELMYCVASYPAISNILQSASSVCWAMSEQGSESGFPEMAGRYYF